MCKFNFVNSCKRGHCLECPPPNRGHNANENVQGGNKCILGVKNDLKMAPSEFQVEKLHTQVQKPYNSITC